jgi:hypothetical protein
VGRDQGSARDLVQPAQDHRPGLLHPHPRVKPEGRLFTHDPEHKRIKQAGPSETTIYLSDPASGVHVEKVSGTGGAVKAR